MLSLIQKTGVLILPILFPSWRFFKSIDASPRIQWAGYNPTQADHPEWAELSPRPQSRSLWEIVRSLVFNPERNEALYLVSCAERIADSPTSHFVAQIEERVRCYVSGRSGDLCVAQARFRLVFIEIRDERYFEEIVFTSDPFDISGRGPH